MVTYKTTIKHTDHPKSGKSRDGSDSFVEGSVMPPLKAKEQRELVAQFQAARASGDVETAQAALDTLVVSNMGLVIFKSEKYRVCGFEVGDAIGQGAIALMTAAEKFDPSKNVNFASYAGTAVDNQIQRDLTNNWHDVRVPVHVAKLPAVIATFKANHDREPTVEELAGIMKNSPEIIAAALTAQRPTEGLHDPVTGELRRDIADTRGPSSNNFVRDELRYALDSLEASARIVVERIYGIGDAVLATPEELANELGKSLKEIQALRTAGVRQLKRMLDPDL